ncbi:hypothetical protein EHS25_005587 [Saitozyma podzolica]|uniref:Uncharacterized protein n=1 Tax=Saitozyma podzolica TaxID=1890683 RepID=A0A427XXY6_9TREE|nr:hypothetical protein EHS25_005587 [Saitozyma podzolica]
MHEMARLMEARNGQYKDVRDIEFAEDERRRRIKPHSQVILIKSTEFGWIQFVKGPQDAIIAAEAWIGSFAFWAWFQDENPPLTA